MTLRDELDVISPQNLPKMVRIIEGTLDYDGEGLTEEERVELMEILVSGEVRTETLTTLLRKRGYNISATSVARYRKTLNESK